MNLRRTICLGAFGLAVWIGVGTVADEPALADEVELLFKKRQFSAVIARLSPLRAERRSELPPKAVYWLGVSYFETGEPAYAEPLLLAAARNNEEPEIRFDALVRLAQIARQLGKPERAVRLLMKAVDESPTQADFQRAVLLIGEIEEQFDREAALRTYTELLKAFPDNRAARLNHLKLLHRLGRFQEAIAAASVAMKEMTVQEQAHVIYLLAACYQGLQNYSKAIELYEQLLQTFPHSEIVAEARYALAFCHYASGDFETAATQAEAMLRGGLSRAERLRYQWLAAAAHERLLQWQTAKDFYREIVETTADPAEAARAVRRMIEMAQKQGRAFEAEELARQLREKLGENAEDPPQ